MKAFVSWSGGKESSLCCYIAMQKLKIANLLNMISEDGKYSRSHGLNAMLLKAQSEAIGIPIVQRKTTWQNYEQEFKSAVLQLKEQGVEAGVFGDIDLQEHREWVERVCRELDIQPILPLWGKSRSEVIDEFINSGFDAFIVATQADLLGSEWLGRRIDQKFVKDIRQLVQVDICGETGEYHTFVTNGPIFKQKINILAAQKVKIGQHWFWNVTNYALENKNRTLTLRPRNCT